MPANQIIAVIGGGPAGAMCAASLLKGWRQRAREESGQGKAAPRVLVFEEKRGWEKPCGGGLTWKALKKYPFLNGGVTANTVREMEVTAGTRRVQFPLRKPIAIYARRELNALLLSRAEQAGAEIVEDRITDVKLAGNGWRLKGVRATHEANFVVLAAGARSRLRSLLAGDLLSRDFMLTYGYYIRQSDPVLRIECFRDFDGYAWSFPRLDHLSVGICGRAGECSMARLKSMLHDLMRRHGYIPEGAPIFAHLLPSLSLSSWRNLILAGPGWALAGDAAGLVDPITGEGIYFAMRSGELLAESLICDDSQPGRLCAASYGPRVQAEFANMLTLGARASRYFYHWNFAGDATPIRLIQLVKHSRSFMNLLQDLIEGKQTYDGLAHRILRELPGASWEVAAGRAKSPPKKQPTEKMDSYRP